MSDQNPKALPVQPAQAVRERSLLRNVYLWMTGGLALTAVVALGVASNPQFIRSLLASRFLFFALLIAEVALVWFLSARISTLDPAAAVGGFVAYAVLNGVTLSVILLAYARASIANALFISAGTFAGMSLYAVTTKRDLSRFGTYLIYGLWGILIASLVNLFLRSPAVQWAAVLPRGGPFPGPHRLRHPDHQALEPGDRGLGRGGGLHPPFHPRGPEAVPGLHQPVPVLPADPGPKALGPRS